MGQGKYSPTIFYRHDLDTVEFVYNAKGVIPPEYTIGELYDEEIHFGNYDSEGFDSYGYSAYDENGQFVGIGQGVDRNGYTEYEYLCMSEDQFNNI